ncbi:hypothetical protein ACINB_31180 [Acidovorax sp. NB1]|nr:hypothetical protein ACINB_31180 [Acidovorax sp. NB1]
MLGLGGLRAIAVSFGGCGNGQIGRYRAGVFGQGGKSGIGAICTRHGGALLGIKLGLQLLLFAQCAAAPQLLGQLHAHLARLGATEGVGQLGIAPALHCRTLRNLAGFLVHALLLKRLLLLFLIAPGRLLALLLRHFCGLRQRGSLLHLVGYAGIDGQRGAGRQRACSRIEAHGHRARHGGTGGLVNLVIRALHSARCVQGCLALRGGLGLLLGQRGGAIGWRGLRHCGLALLLLLQGAQLVSERLLNAVHARVAHGSARLLATCGLRVAGCCARLPCLGLAESVVTGGCAPHCRARQHAHDHGRIHVREPVLAQRDVLEHLLGHRLRQFLQEALGNGALHHAAGDALGGLLLHQRIHGGTGRVIRIGLGHALGALGQQGFSIANAQLLGHAPTERTDCSASHAGSRGKARLGGGQQTIRGFLADLLGRRARHRDALTSRARQRCTSGAHLAKFGGSHQAARGNATGAHGRKRLANRTHDHAGVGKRHLGFFYDAIGLLELLVLLLGGVRVEQIARGLLGLLEPKAHRSTLVLQGFADCAAGGDVEQANRRFRHGDSATGRDPECITYPTLETARWRLKASFDIAQVFVVSFGFAAACGRCAKAYFLVGQMLWVHPPTLSRTRESGKPYAGARPWRCIVPCYIPSRRTRCRSPTSSQAYSSRFVPPQQAPKFIAARTPLVS